MWITYTARSQNHSCGGMRSVQALLRLGWILFFIFTAINSSLLFAARADSDEYQALKRYDLPSSAVAFNLLDEEDGFFRYEGEPFSGIAFEHYANGNLQRVMYLHQGVQHGPIYIWYPDAKPQMSAHYRQGRLRGRFLGWYANGNVLYDMMIGANGYIGDYMEDDARLYEEEWGDYEQEGNDNE